LGDGNVRCWGWNAYGELGYGHTNNVGDDETPASVGDVDIGGAVTQVNAGGTRTCAVLVGGHVRCWGSSRLGYPGVSSIGDDETPASAGDVPVN
jgi:alpha-tubulin suppressor-like RCC1 family protein